MILDTKDTVIIFLRVKEPNIGSRNGAESVKLNKLMCAGATDEPTEIRKRSSMSQALRCPRILCSMFFAVES